MTTDPTAKMNLTPDQREWVQRFMMASNASATKLAQQAYGQSGQAIQGYQILEGLTTEVTNHLVAKAQGAFTVSDLAVVCGGMLGIMIGANSINGAEIPDDFPAEVGKMVEGGIRLSMEGVKQSAAQNKVQAVQ